jgi:hypothetical protein
MENLRLKKIIQLETIYEFVDGIFKIKEKYVSD